MNKMMADGTLMRKELEGGTCITVGVAIRKRRNQLPRGLDGAAQAAMITKQLDYLTQAQKYCVVAKFKNWCLPCSCGSPCCSGTRRNPGWFEAIEWLCSHLKEEAELSRKHGRKGLSTHPQMRRALVERFFIQGRMIIISELAEMCGVTPQTVITHKKPIEAYLTQTLNDALSHLDLILNTLDLVGHID
jgi:hypothetical protein